MIIEIHLAATIEACRAAILISENLPETDSTLELKNILSMQLRILLDIIENKHFGSRALDNFIIECRHICNVLEEIEKD